MNITAVMKVELAFISLIIFASLDGARSAILDPDNVHSSNLSKNESSGIDESSSQLGPSKNIESSESLPPNKAKQISLEEDPNTNFPNGMEKEPHPKGKKRNLSRIRNASQLKQRPRVRKKASSLEPTGNGREASEVKKNGDRSHNPKTRRYSKDRSLKYRRYPQKRPLVKAVDVDQRQRQTVQQQRFQNRFATTPRKSGPKNWIKDGSGRENEYLRTRKMTSNVSINKRSMLPSDKQGHKDPSTFLKSNLMPKVRKPFKNQSYQKRYYALLETMRANRGEVKPSKCSDTISED
ncbi:uncharacterized protein LOC131891717 [Tigriopus californicus]|uniref:uncharacterized protein LOC131891717 n=1 Tax=Tigriopus californicus TaxID=6832 RepID=UPI0027DAB14B|nr:uncharacterized protein LOC131891717 [Tigriopus californicus]